MSGENSSLASSTLPSARPKAIWDDSISAERAVSSPGGASSRLASGAAAEPVAVAPRRGGDLEDLDLAAAVHQEAEALVFVDADLKDVGRGVRRAGAGQGLDLFRLAGREKRQHHRHQEDHHAEHRDDGQDAADADQAAGEAVDQQHRSFGLALARTAGEAAGGAGLARKYWAGRIRKCFPS